MSILLSHTTALEALRSPLARRRLNRGERCAAEVPDAPPTLEELDALFERLPSLARPIHVSVSERSRRADSSQVHTHTTRLQLPSDSAIRLAEGIYCSSPEHVVVEMSRMLTHLELVFLLGELLGTYAIVPEPEEGTAQGENVVDYGEEAQVFESAPQKPKKFLENKLLLGEFIAVCALCATILLTNLFWQDSAINTFFRGLVAEETPAAAPDERSYAELTPGSVVADADIECSVSEAGVLTFTGECSVYAPYGGTVESVAETDGVYTVEIEHTTSFSSVISGLSAVYWAAGDSVFSTIPVGYSDGASEVSVRMYDGGSLISSYSVNEENDIVWNV